MRGRTFQNLEFEGVMRFYFQSSESDGQKVATKCIRVSSTSTTAQVVEALVQKFRPDLRMLTTPSLYTLYEVHADGGKLLCVCVRVYVRMGQYIISGVGSCAFASLSCLLPFCVSLNLVIFFNNSFTAMNDLAMTAADEPLNFRVKTSTDVVSLKKMIEYQSLLQLSCIH